jgi:hypothetical protein
MFDTLQLDAPNTSGSAPPEGKTSSKMPVPTV